MAQPNQEHWRTAASVTLRMGDADRLRKVPILYDGFRGLRFDVMDETVAAGLELLEGDADRAAAMFDELFSRLEAVEGPLTAAMWRMIYAWVAPGGPTARMAAEQAHRWFSSAGLQGYLDFGVEVWARHLGQTAVAG